MASQEESGDSGNEDDFSVSSSCGGDKSVAQQQVSRNCVECQIVELQLLESMYSGNELFFSGKIGSEYLKSAALLHKTDCSDFQSWSSLEFLLKIDAPEPESASPKIEITFQLPLHYPVLSFPSVFIRSEALARQNSAQLNSEMRNFVKSLPLGHPMVTEIVQWVAENYEKFANVELNTSPKCSEIRPPETFSRIWFYAHHIYSSTKRRNLISLAQERDLSGFSLPGKPGVICVEGYSFDCKEYADLIRAWNWKKLVVRHKEDFEITESISALRKFENFKEESFRIKQEPGRTMDMGLFLEFLKKHDSGEMFQVLFGIEGK